MTLRSGTMFGGYEIGEPLGAGGMGEVYRARDPRLKREVAIKVLPESFAADPDRLARLQREAEVLASLNHPHIAQIHGLEEIGETRALIMELVEGETLADRLLQGPIDLPDALQIAQQIAEALEAAHERGVIHRDVKPANIKITPNGTVKVLDFGLAKAMEPAATSAMSRSPTVTTPAMTQAGVILGTAAYMSPEQARGGTVDKRADIWAFGVVLYEMLAAERLFDEDSVADTLAGVLKSDVRLDRLPAQTPRAVRAVLARCLTRDPRRRLRDIGEARIAIDDALTTSASTSSEPEQPSSLGRLPLGQRLLPWTLAASALIAALIVAWAPWRGAAPRGAVTRVVAEFGAETTLAPNTGPSAALSADGTMLAYAGRLRAGDRTRLFIRPLDRLQASPVPGTDGARNVFFSPDGQWIGFFADNKLKKVSVNGGAAVTLCDAPDERGGSWAEGGWIAFAPRSGEMPLLRVSADGGAPEPLTRLSGGEITHRWPQVLPGGGAVLFTAHSALGNYENANIVVYSVATGQKKIVHRGGYYGRYLPSGHLVYMSEGTLFAAAFDVERLEIVGQAFPVLSDVLSTPGTGAAQFTTAGNGTVAYVVAGGANNASLDWLGRDGKTQRMRTAVGSITRGLRFSPDGERLAIALRDPQADIWLYEWKRDAMIRLTTDQSLDADPVWTPDSRRIAFRSARHGVDNLFWARVDGTGETQRLTESKVVQFPLSWHPSGKFLAFFEYGNETGADIWMLPMNGNEASGWKPGQPTLFLGGRFEETEARFSPDGRWLAYESDESGRSEVYVTPFPGPGARSQVSSTGGMTPRWSSKGNELFFRSADQQIMVATYSVQGASFHTDKPRLLSEAPVANYDVFPDGQRLVVATPQESPSSSRDGKLVFIFNFAEELRLLGAAR